MTGSTTKPKPPILNHIYITPEARTKQERLIMAVPDEIAWFGLVRDNDRGLLIVDDIVVPEQEVSSHDVDYDMESIHKWMEENPNDVGRLRYFGHSHGSHGVFLSKTDKDDFIEMMKQTGVPYIACYVGNRKGEEMCQVEIFEIAGKKLTFAIEAELRTTIPQTILDWVDNEVSEKVSKKTYIQSWKKGDDAKKSTTPSSSSTGSGTSSTTPASSDGTEITKVESDETSFIIVHRQCDVPDKGDCILYTKSHREVYKDGAFKSMMTRAAWEQKCKEDREKAEDKEKKASGGSKKVPANSDLKDTATQERPLQTPIVKSLKSVSKEKRIDRQENLAREVRRLLRRNEWVFVTDEGHYFTLIDESEVCRFLDDDYEWDDDTGWDWSVACAKGLMDDSHITTRGALLS